MAGSTNPISPGRLALYSYLIFLVSLIFPPSWYTSLIHEPDLMFLNLTLFLFYTACVLAFLAGLRLTQRSTAKSLSQPANARGLSLLAICVPLLFFTAWCALYIIVLGRQIDFAAILTSQQGNLIKLAGASSQLQPGQLDKAVPFLTAGLWWAYPRAQQQAWNAKERRVFSLVFATSLLAGASVCVATVDRTRLMPIVIGTVILAVHRQYVLGKLNLVRLATLGISGIVMLLGIFLGFSFLRGAGNLDLLAYSLLGYSLVSYNRTAALLSNVLYPAYQGKGVYLFFYLTETEQLENIFHFRGPLNWPNFVALFNSEFQAVSAAGLNQAFNWFGTFGYLYTDLGWWAPCYMLLVGVLTGYIWNGFQQQKTLCFVLYPWFAFSILFWIGWNVLFSQDAFFLLESFALLFLYDKILSKPVVTEEPQTSKQRSSLHARGAFDRGLRSW